MTVGLFIELLVNFIQQFVFVGFLYLFFDKTDNKIVNISKSKESNTICFFIYLESLKALDRHQPIYGLALSYIVFYP